MHIYCDLRNSYNRNNIVAIAIDNSSVMISLFCMFLSSVSGKIILHTIELEEGDREKVCKVYEDVQKHLRIDKRQLHKLTILKA